MGKRNHSITPKEKTFKQSSTRPKHPSGWTPYEHYGMCGQSCPCCRSKIEGPNELGTCEICNMIPNAK